MIGLPFRFKPTCFQQNWLKPTGLKLALIPLLLGINGEQCAVAQVAQPHVGLQTIGLEGFSSQDIQILAKIIRLVGGDVEIVTAPFSFVAPLQRNGRSYKNAKLLLQNLFKPGGSTAPFTGHIKLTSYLYFHDRETRTGVKTKDNNHPYVSLPFNAPAISQWQQGQDWAKAKKLSSSEKIFLTELKTRCEIFAKGMNSLQKVPNIQAGQFTYAYVPYLEDIGSNTSHNLGYPAYSKLEAFCEYYLNDLPADRRSPNNGISHLQNLGALELHSFGVFPSDKAGDFDRSVRFRTR